MLFPYSDPYENRADSLTFQDERGYAEPRGRSNDNKEK